MPSAIRWVGDTRECPSTRDLGGKEGARVCDLGRDRDIPTPSVPDQVGNVLLLGLKPPESGGALVGGRHQHCPGVRGERGGGGV